MSEAEAYNYVTLYEQWLNETDGDARLIIEHKMALMEEKHPILRDLK
ncbi:hypothetical protein [Cohnella yongneupensis]|uniref:Uncharacterized protein n=1 Tax=Cohnella yongneupensis TaxID=425006 RepID=A0ABW0QVX2_9BACL